MLVVVSLSGIFIHHNRVSPSLCAFAGAFGHTTPHAFAPATVVDRLRMRTKVVGCGGKSKHPAHQLKPAMPEFPETAYLPRLLWQPVCKCFGVTECIVGCCGWTQAQARYVNAFDAIELQTTFYQPPGDAVARKWKLQARPAFRFCMKAWQLITHTPSSPTYRRMKFGIADSEKELYGSFRPTEQVAFAWQRTREIAKIINAQVIVFQCPASFLPTCENISNLERFFQEIDRGTSIIAWEPRGEDWTDQLVRAICAANRLVHCVDPFIRDSAYGESLYWRLHGRAGYRYRYTDDDLAELGAKLEARRPRPRNTSCSTICRPAKMRCVSAPCALGFHSRAEIWGSVHYWNLKERTQ